MSEKKQWLSSSSSFLCHDGAHLEDAVWDIKQNSHSISVNHFHGFLSYYSSGMDMSLFSEQQSVTSSLSRSKTDSVS